MNAPIVVFAYNREEHLKRCLKALEVSASKHNSDLFIFVDGPKKKDEAGKVNAVRQFALSYKSSAFNSVSVCCSEENKGLAQSIITGITEVIHKYGEVIVVEDDLVVTPGFIDFMNQALSCFKEDNRIWSVGGWIPDGMYGISVTDAFLSLRAECWGWATWEDRWNLIDWSICDYKKKFRYSFLKRKSFNKAGNDMAEMLDAYYEKKINSWAIRFAYSQWKNKRYVVCPKFSMVNNEGFDGSGTNCHKNSIVQKTNYDRLTIDSYISVDPNLIRKYYHSISCKGLRRLINFIKRPIHLILYDFRKTMN